MSECFAVSLKDICVSFANHSVLKDFSLNIKNGDFVTLLGPSGCGKTTILRVMGGFVVPRAGEVFFSGKNVTKLPPHKREVNTIFQNYALFPHLNVYENIAFGLRIKKENEKEIDFTVNKMLDLVNLKDFKSRDVQSLYRCSLAQL